MNILYLEHYVGGPEYGMEFRPYYLAREWVKQGHEVHIIGATYSHLRRRQPKAGHELLDGIHFHWWRTPHYSNALLRIVNMLWFIFLLMIRSRRLARQLKPDLVIASSTYPLDNYPACRIARLANARYVYEVHDLWPLSPMEIGHYSASHPFIRVMQRAEDYAYRHVDKVVSLLWNAESHMREHGLPEGRFVCVPNGYEPTEWQSPEPLPEEHLQALAALRTYIVVGFAGSLTASEGLETLIRAAARVQDTELRFVIVGTGDKKDALQRLTKELKLQNIIFLPPVIKRAIPNLLSHFNIGYMGGINSPLHLYGTAYNKQTDYLLSALPVMQAMNEPGSVIEREACGLRVGPEDPEALADALRRFARMTNEERHALGLRGRQYVTEQLSWEKLSQRFIAAINE